MPYPAYELLLSELVARTAEPAGVAVITIPTSLLKFLVQARLPHDEFDPAAYLAAYPDIAQAVAAGQFSSALQHFLGHGYFEGRTQGAGIVDEAFYRAAYPDVAAAIESGAFASAADHYYRQGILEWRAPSAAAVAGIARWKAALAGADLALPLTAAAPEVALPG